MDSLPHGGLASGTPQNLRISSSRRTAALALIAAAMAAPARALGQGRTESAHDAFPLLGGYLALPPQERTLFHTAYRSVRRGRLLMDLQAAIVDPGGPRRPITLDRLGFVERLPSLAELHGGAQVWFASEPFRFQIEARATIAPAPRLEPAVLAEAIAQLDGSLDKVVGGLAIFIPKMTATFFPEGVGGRVRMANGAAAPLGVFQTPLDGPTPYFEPARFPGATAVELDQIPTRITIGIPRLLSGVIR